MIIQRNGQRVAVTTASAAESPCVAKSTITEIPASDRDANARPARVRVELSRALGGMHMRAILGGAFKPDPRSNTVVIDFCPAVEAEDVPLIDSVFWTPLRCGLPLEYFEVLDAEVVLWCGEKKFPAGTVKIDEVGYDEWGSSEVAYRLTAGLLVVTLRAYALGLKPQELLLAETSLW